MNRIASQYIDSLKDFYSTYLAQKKKAKEKEYHNALSRIYELASELLPESATIALREEGRQKMRALNYLRGECDSLDKRGDMYGELKLTELKGDINFDYNIIGVLNSGTYYSIANLQKVDWQEHLKLSGNKICVQSPYHSIFLAKDMILIYARCWRYMVLEDKYREFFKYMIYEYLCNDLEIQGNVAYLQRLERLRNEIKTNFAMQIEECKDRDIVELNYFRKL